ncbi:MAG: tetratricopeptide repeat protein [Pseudohongiellaceae bacterium]
MHKSSSQVRTLVFVVALTLLASCTSVRNDTTEVDLLRKAASAALDRGELGIALSNLREALVLSPNDIEALRLVSRFHGTVGDESGQRQAAERIIALAPEDSESLETLGLLSLREGRLQEAVEYLQRTVEIAPESWRAWNGLGIIADIERQFSEAEHFFQYALAILPGHPKLVANLGWSRVLAGDYVAAELLLLESLETMPDAAVTRSNLAFCIALQGRYEQAMEIYRSLYGDSVASNNIGYAAMVRNDSAGARQYLEKAMQLEPSFYDKAADNLNRLNARIE